MNGESETNANQQIISSISTLSQYPGKELPEDQTISDHELPSEKLADEGRFVCDTEFSPEKLAEELGQQVSEMEPEDETDEIPAKEPVKVKASEIKGESF